MQGIPYSQEQEGEEHLRTANTPKALSNMDCSEFVCRVLHADGITKKVEAMDTHGLKTYLSNEEVFEHSMTPQVGDVALWKGHTGIVTEVDEKTGKYKLTHARGNKKLSQENPHFTTTEVYRNSEFYGFYRPKEENNSSASNPSSTTTTGTSSNSTSSQTVISKGKDSSFIQKVGNWLQEHTIIGTGAHDLGNALAE